MAWSDNPYKGIRLDKFEMTPEERKALFGFCQTPDTSLAEKNELVTKFWQTMGKANGFEFDSISCLKGCQFDAARS